MIQTGAKSIYIRAENRDSSEELAIIRAINDAAFGGRYESALVDQLRADGHALLALVAEDDSRLVGHIMFSRMGIETAAGSIPAVALAPVAVLPEYQRQGIGARLIESGLDLLRNRGEKIVIVVGHPAYYPRFGFSNDKASALASPFPAEAFMALELSPKALQDVRGKVIYPSAFGI